MSLRASNVVNATIFRVDLDTSCEEYNPKRAVRGSGGMVRPIALPISVSRHRCLLSDHVCGQFLTLDEQFEGPNTTET